MTLAGRFGNLREMQNVAQREAWDDWLTATTGIALAIVFAIPLWAAVIALGRWLV